MRKLCFLLMVLVLASGCPHFPTHADKDKAHSAAEASRAPVMPDQVKENTAHRVADALDEEVHVDETTPAKPAPPADAPK